MSSPTDVIQFTAERWVTGDNFAIAIPADPESLLGGGAEFLTRAFRAANALSAHNSVVAIADSEEFFDGGSGKKLKLTVVYEHPDASLPERLAALWDAWVGAFPSIKESLGLDAGNVVDLEARRSLG